MNYSLVSPGSQIVSTEKEIAAAQQKWEKHSFYATDIVLGIDMGLEGIGLWLRKGTETLFAQTIRVETPDAAPLQGRRANRAARRARVSLRKRERQLQDWIVKFGLLSKERVDAIWNDTAVFQRAFELRHRALKARGSLKSAEALVACIRHCVGLRGYDYHLINMGGFPWGDEMESPEAILQWAKHASSPPTAVEQWKILFQDAPWSDNADKVEKVFQALDETAERFQNAPIENHLEKHLRESHPNLRERARGQNFPRELVKAHVRKICEHHDTFFGTSENFRAAMVELLGEDDQTVCEGCIIDFHQKTRKAVEKLWRRKINVCAMLPHLSGPGSAVRERCAEKRNGSVRRFQVLQFLAERRFVVLDGEMPVRRYADADLFTKLQAILEADIAATMQSPAKLKRHKLTVTELKKLVQESCGQKLAQKQSMNVDYFQHLRDLLSPRLSELSGRASLSASAADGLIRIGMDGALEFAPALIRANWRDTYYQWRRDNIGGGPVYPQVELLLGNPSHYKSDGTTRDLNDGDPQQHGILRRLFAGQFRDAQDNCIDLHEKLGGKTCPDVVILETVGDIPRNKLQRSKIQKDQKAKREAKLAIREKFNLPEHATSAQIKRALLFDQQANKTGEAFCPYTGQSLETNPEDPNLEVEHLYPQQRGGISEMINIALTRRDINLAKGNRTPFEVQGECINGVQFLSWLEMKRQAQASMKWNKRKLEIFCREESECPDWQNLTRIAQLARQMRDHVIQWMGLHRGSDDNQRANEIARRIGTPSGAMTAACRESWKESLPLFLRGKKDRTYLRHHLYDAAVLAHIPPGEGVQLVRNGGILITARTPGLDWVNRAIPEILPDLNAFEQANLKRCLVYKQRAKHSKTSRYDSTIYSPVDENGDRWTRFKAELSELCKDPKFTLEKVKQHLRIAGIGPERLPDKLIEAWYSQDLSGKSPIKILRFPGFKPGTPGQKIERVTRKISKPCAEPAYGPHHQQTAEIIGWKVAQETFVRAEIWGADEDSTTTYFVRRVLHPRHLRNLQKRTLPDGRVLSLDLPLRAADLRSIGLLKDAESLEKAVTKIREKNSADKSRSKTQDELFPEAENSEQSSDDLTTTLRRLYCEETSVPKFARKVGTFENGKVLMVPFDADGKFCKAGSLENGGDPGGGWFAYSVSAIKSDGEIAMMPIEFNKPSEDSVCDKPYLKFPLRLASPPDLAFLLNLQNHLRTRP